ncbi:hypothetical protein [Streptosporangium carneum]|uniref:Uncharacterized protein n=1 Tax=Streptosporangium carneum TaxID=47481 RepID=A0A9W6I4D4_9ACTN|nr:hypothetical protein [Streptosporangium carneum]GLK11836.1 hypothetical protein GCM10017600_52440 [Streptosporangium carneum]
MKRVEATGPALRWPNAAFPGLSPFVVRPPEGWVMVEPPGALVAFLGPPIGGFCANLVVLGERLPKEVTVGAVAERTLRDAGAETIVEPLVADDAIARPQRPLSPALAPERPSGASERPSSGEGLLTQERPPVALREALTHAAGHDLRQLVLATETADWSPGGSRSVFVLVATHLVARTTLDERVLVDALASFAPVPAATVPAATVPAATEAHP